MTYDGELIRAETGETEDDKYWTDSLVELMAMVRSLKDGDTIVINAHD